MRELNELFNIQQEQNRNQEAKNLKEKRKKYLKLLDEKINDNVHNFHKGISVKCNFVNKNGNNNSKTKLTNNNILTETNVNDVSFNYHLK